MSLLIPHITDRKRWSWQGAMALLVAGGIFTICAVITIGVAVKLARGIPIAPSTVSLLTAALSALIGTVSAFLGRMSGSPSGPVFPLPGPPPPPPLPTAPKD
jgi:hypothetical protein